MLSNNSTMLEEDPEVDLIFLEGAKVFPGDRLVPLNDGYNKANIFNMETAEVYSHLMRLNKYPGSACTKLVKRALVTNNNIYFRVELLAEDIEWTLNLFSFAKTFNYCDFDYYRYRQGRKGSVTDKITKRHLDSLTTIIREWASDSLEINGPFQNFVNSSMAYEYIIVMANSWNLVKTQRKNIRLLREMLDLPL